jgi:hypothetical protein
MIESDKTNFVECGLAPDVPFARRREIPFGQAPQAVTAFFSSSISNCCS